MYAKDRGEDPVPPIWFEDPALSRFTVSSPALLRAFHSHNDGVPYEDALKPFNFLLVAHLTEDERRRRGAAFRLGAPYTRNQRETSSLGWRNLRAAARNSGTAFRITTEADASLDDETLVCVNSYGDVIREYLEHPEAKSVDSAAIACGPDTRGQLFPRHAESD
jgi:hypothetical protein